MLRAALLVASAAAVALALASPTMAVSAAFKAPHNAFGQPDISGVWTNVTLTPLIRNSKFGDQLVMPEASVKSEEAFMARLIADGNKPTDPDAPVPKGPVPGAPAEFQAAGGDTGGYNVGWLEPGLHVMRVNGEPRTSLLTTPNGQVPPRKGAPSQARRSWRDWSESFDSYETRPLGERCILSFGRNAGPPMLPNSFYNNNYQIIQTPDSVAIDVEMVHDVRIVRLNGKHRTDGVRAWMGDSIGWWEGDTLVVETTNIPEKQEFYGSWKNLKITERFTRLAPDRLLYRFTVEDPTLWEKPWGGEYEFSPLKGAIYEYACHEGNYALPGLLAGAREAEKEAAAKAAAGPKDKPGA